MAAAHCLAPQLHSTQPLKSSEFQSKLAKRITRPLRQAELQGEQNEIERVQTLGFGPQSANASRCCNSIPNTIPTLDQVRALLSDQAKEQAIIRHVEDFFAAHALNGQSTNPEISKFSGAVVRG